MPQHMPDIQPKLASESRRVALFRNGRNQALRIPRDLELETKEALITKEGNRLVIEPIEETPTLLEFLATLEPLQEDFPNVDESLGKLDDIEL